MKKVYLVKATNIKVKTSTRSFVDVVFNNAKLADAYVNFWNKDPNREWQYWVEEKEICKADYTNF